MKRLSLVLLAVATVTANCMALEIRYPENQKSFIGNVLVSRNGYMSSTNPVGQGSERAQRRYNLEIYRKQKIENWIGSIYQMSTTSDGTKAWIRIQIDPHIMVSTANNGWDAEYAETLIPWRSDLHRELLSLKRNDWIIFSGKFYPSSTDGLREMSMTMHGSMTDPEFLFKFTSIQKINKDDIKVDSIFGSRM